MKKMLSASLMGIFAAVSSGCSQYNVSEVSYEPGSYGYEIDAQRKRVKLYSNENTIVYDFNAYSMVVVSSEGRIIRSKATLPGMMTFDEASLMDYSEALLCGTLYREVDLSQQRRAPDTVIEYRHGCSKAAPNTRIVRRESAFNHLPG